MNHQTDETESESNEVHQTDETESESNEVVIPLMNHETDKTESQSNIEGFIRYYCRIPRRCLFIQGVVVTNSLTELAVVSILITYLTEVRKEKLINAAATVNILEFLSGFLSVPASILKYHLGCHTMIYLTTEVYIMGLVLLYISASIKTSDATIKNPSYIFENLLLYVGLYVMALGRAGSNSSCVEDFFGEQLEKNVSNSDIDKKRNRARQMFWMRASQFFGVFLGTVTLANDTDWGFRYWFFALMMQLALGVFLIGSRFKCLKKAATTTDTPHPPHNDVEEQERERLQNDEVETTTTTDTPHPHPPPDDIVEEQKRERLQNDEEEAATTTDTPHPHPHPPPPPPPDDIVEEQKRERLQINDEVEAATTTDTPHPHPHPHPNDVDEQERDRLQRNNEVEENKKNLRLLVPISMTFLIYGIVKSIGSTFFLEQGNNMKDNQNSGSPIPPITILIIVSSFSRTSLTICIKRLLRNRLPGVRKIYAMLIIIGVGLIFSIICCATAQAVEVKRLGIIVKNGLQDITGDKEEDPVVPMSVFWLLPQFIFLGAMKGLIGDGMESFFESELPKYMRRYASEVTKAVTEIGTLVSVGLVSIAAKASTIGGGSSWFANTVNKSHLDRFYRSLTILCLIFCLVYAYVSTSYMRKRLPRNEDEDSEEIAQPELNLEMTAI